MANSFVINKELTGTVFDKKVKPEITNKDFIDATTLQSFIDKFNEIICYWKDNQTYIDGLIFQINFKTIISKSKRLSKLFNADSYMVGSFYRHETKSGRTIPKHSMVFYFNDFEKAELIVRKMNCVKEKLDKKYNGRIDKSNWKLINENEFVNQSKEYNQRLILDLSRIEGFDFPDKPSITDDEMMVHFYVVPKGLLEKMNVIISSFHNNTAILKDKVIAKINSEAPYFMAFAHNAYINQPQNVEIEVEREVPFLPSPTDEDYIGVLDTDFDNNCYLGEWVESVDLRSDIYKETADINEKFHGTEVCSLVVHGNDLNEDLGLQDNCGYFRVKHFTIANKKHTSTKEILKNIEKAVRENRNVKVWNLSLGTVAEINEHYISPVAELVDKLQAEYKDIIFVVAATNNEDTTAIYSSDYKIGSPADSINSLVVGSVKLSERAPASYSRKGGVLEYYIKPDVSYFGGDDNQKIYAYNGFKIRGVSGTSFAAPLVARKVAYIMYTLKLNRDVAKALIIDSACKWDNYDNPLYIGRGIVPDTIQEIVNPQENEIRFVYSDSLKQFSSSDYTLPIPLNKDHNLNFRARALMSYCTQCNVNYGVDYTNVEVDLKFGSIKDGKIKPLKHDYQYDGNMPIEEKDARKAFAKWDNVKRIVSVNQKKFGDGWASDNKWGFNLYTVFRNKYTRLDGETIKYSEEKNKYDFKFGVVVTLKSLDGKDHSDEFFKMVQGSSWDIKEIHVINKTKLYQEAKETLVFEEDEDKNDNK